MRLLTEIQQKPRYILLENVKGFRTSRMIEKWHECLEQNGYTWREYLVSPIHLGIPNHRQRYYMICERSRRWVGLEHTPQLSLSSSNIPQKMRTVAEYINTSLDGEQLADVIVPESTLQQNWAQQLGVVTAADTATHCFTAAYGRIFHKATGSLLLMPDNIDGDVEQQEALAVKPLDRLDMLQYVGRLRRFTPKELLALFGFPSHYEFPSDLNLEQQYKLIGNSINVIVVAELVKELLFGDEESTLVVGGTNGHVPETIDGNLLLLYRSHRWKMIPNCMGRHTCRDHSLVSPLPPLELLERAGIENLDGSRMPETSIQLKEYRLALPGRPDKVVVVPLDSQNRTGLITFIKEGTSYVHTLNTPSGFRRKLEAIGIRASETDICLAVDADAGIG
jgi:tRNA (cytosine38-C5)-methyltransferase